MLYSSHADMFHANVIRNFNGATLVEEDEEISFTSGSGDHLCTLINAQIVILRMFGPLFNPCDLLDEDLKLWSSGPLWILLATYHLDSQCTCEQNLVHEKMWRHIGTRNNAFFWIHTT